MSRYRARPLQPAFWVLALGIALLLLGAGRVGAQGPEQTEAFVYGINASIAGTVLGTFAPPSVERLYLLAGQPNVLSPRRTLVYFWPISNEFRAAWSQMNEEVEGTLEVTQGERPVASVEAQPYTVQFTAGGGEMGPHPQIFVGEEATEAERLFQEGRAAHEAAMRAYQSAHDEWLAKARVAQEEGTTATLPPAPEPPPAYEVYSTGLRSGYLIDLPAGSYQIQTRLPDGTIAAESTRELEIFGARRTAVGYKVIPESRWTFPEQLNDLSDMILGAAGSTLYLQPEIIREYPRTAYARLQNPQERGGESGAEWEWVSGEALDEGQLEIVRNGQVVEQQSLTPYYVVQVPGREFGYEIRPYDAAAAAARQNVDFSAYRIVLDEKTPAYSVRLRSPENTVLVGSERAVRVAPPASRGLLGLLALLPVGVGALVHLWRRGTIKPTRPVA